LNLAAPNKVVIVGDTLYKHGDQLKLNCSSEGGPNLEYRWSLSGNEELLDNTVTDSNTLITNAEQGDYTCTVSNNAGFSSATVTVYSKLSLMLLQMI